MTTAKCDRHWLKTLVRVVAVNCVAGAIPAAFQLMIDSRVSRVEVLHSLIAGAVFANAIGLPLFVVWRLNSVTAWRTLAKSGAAAPVIPVIET